MNDKPIKFPMTLQRYEVLKQELQGLLEKDKVQVIEDIAEARAHGDLSENAEYSAAREKQANIERRIALLISKINNCEIIDANQLQGDTVKFGATVTLEDLDNDEVMMYVLMGEDDLGEIDNAISINGPLGRALIGKKAGEEVDFVSPKGDRNLKILKVEFI